MSVICSTTGETLNLNEIYKYLAEIVPKCGQIILDAFYKEKTLENKMNFADFATETDKNIEKILIDALKVKYPTHGFIGEETTVDKVKFTNDPVWIVDPVDGTTNFVHQFPHCALSIGFYVNKEAQIGVVFNPIRNELFSAIRGQGAYLNGRTLRHSNQKDLGKSQIISEFGSGRKSTDLDIKIKNMRNLIEKVHSLRSLGSAALNVCLVANGSCDLYYEYGIHIWDIAACALIAKEAGCYVVGGSGETLDPIKRTILVSSTKELADQVLPLLTPVEYESD